MTIRLSVFGAVRCRAGHVATKAMPGAAAGRFGPSGPGRYFP